MLTLALIAILTGIAFAVIIDAMSARSHLAAWTARQHLPLSAWPKLWQASAGAWQGLPAACLAASCILALPPLASADPVPTSRRIDWSVTGVPGGIPNRTAICATFSPGATDAAINNAINACNNGVVYLNAGTYTFSGTINVSSNVTLRGAGADKTIIIGAGHVVMAGNTGQPLGTAITGGATKGSTTFTVASTSNLSVGEMIEISRTDDPNLIPFFNSWSPSNGRSIVQVDVITAISSTTVTLRNPLIFDFASGTPQVKFYYPSSVSRAGIEDLQIDLQGQGGAAIDIQGCDSCWVKGAEIHNGGDYMVRVDSSVNLELRDNFVHDGGAGPNHSGIAMLSDYRYGGSSNAKIENNILNKMYPNIEINNDSTGLFIGYNYSPGSNGNGGNRVIWNLDDNHAPFPVMNLYEGNIADMWGSDAYYGGSGYGTALRNYFSGYNWSLNGGGDAVWLKRLAYNYNVVGNVLGSTQQNPVGYLGCGDWSTQFNTYTLGYPNLDNCDTANTTPDSYVPPGGYPDQKVTSTLLRWGNYDYFNKVTRFVASEIPAGVVVPSDQLIPKSYAYAATPSWWPSTIPWPPIGPDVTGGNGDTSGHVNKIPAQVCWETSNLANGGSFNASACYAANASAKPAITSPPTASGTIGSPFSYIITATNNPTSFNAAGLPAGLSVNTANGVISGTPTAAGPFSVTLSATNAAGTGTAPLALTISALPVPVITSLPTASGTAGTPFNYTITATNNPISFSAAVLPPGLTVATTTGVISGTPTAVGFSSVTLSATNANGTGNAKLALTISAAAVPPSITSAPTASGTIGSPFSYTITATNNPTSYNATNLPAWASVNTSTGVISGTPTAAGPSTVTLSATNAAGTGTAMLTLTIGASPDPAPSTLAIDQTVIKDQDTGSTITTAPFSTASSNELLLAFISTDSYGGSPMTVTNVTTAGLAWTLVQRTNTALGTAEVWKAFATSTLTNVSVTATLPQSVAASMTVVTFTGSDGAGASGGIGATLSASAAPGEPTGTITTTRSNSWLFGVGNDWDNAIPRTYGPMQTMVHQYLASVGDTYWVQRRTAKTPTSGTTVNLRDTGPTGDQFNLSIVEVLPRL